jgi:DNA repair protein RecN (Recombination protein N)
VIEQLRIKNLGVIRDATLDFAPGLTVLTGETGAGKTMVFRSLHLLFGGKADSALISTGAAQALVEADVLVEPNLLDWFSERGAQLDDNVLILSRQVNDTGRSRSFLGGVSVPATVVSDCGEQLVAVHGQSDQLRLTKAEQQRLLLDRFAGAEVADLLSMYRSHWEMHRELGQRIEALTSDSVDRDAQLERLTQILSQVDSLKPQPGEDHALHDEARRGANTEALFGAAMVAVSQLSGDDSSGASISQALATARKALEHEQAVDASLEQFVVRLREVEILVAELSSDLNGYASAIDASPARLAQIETRRAALKQLARGFVDIDDVLAWVEVNRPRLAELQGGDEALERLHHEQEATWQKLVMVGEQLTHARTQAAARFSQAVSEELAGLAMAGASVDFQFTPVAPGLNGADGVELGLISRPNAPRVPIHKGASGGELSRIMLAVEVVLAQADPIGTFVFDEVDAGVGGQAAVEVGKRLARLARTSQVIVVTHLPQVAAFADRHLVVARAEGDEVHSSQVVAVSEQDRVVELSRMLAGLEDSQAGEQLARDLLEVAEAERRHAHR